jgi:predicted GNAT family acetyltransferase
MDPSGGVRAPVKKSRVAEKKALTTGPDVPAEFKGHGSSASLQFNVTGVPDELRHRTPGR